MTMTTQRNDFVAQMTDAAVEMFTLYADTNQKVLRELVDLSAIAAKEGVRLYAELQSSAVEAVKDGQAYALRRQTDMEGSPADPLTFCQRGVTESTESAQRSLQALREQCPGGDALGRAAPGQRRACRHRDPGHLRPPLGPDEGALRPYCLTAWPSGIAAGRRRPGPRSLLASLLQALLERAQRTRGAPPPRR